MVLQKGRESNISAVVLSFVLYCFCLLSFSSSSFSPFISTLLHLVSRVFSSLILLLLLPFLLLYFASSFVSFSSYSSSSSPSSYASSSSSCIRLNLQKRILAAGTDPQSMDLQRARTHAHTHTGTQAHTHVHTHARTHAHSGTHARTNARTHACARTRARAHTHTHTHTYYYLPCTLMSNKYKTFSYSDMFRNRNNLPTDVASAATLEFPARHRYVCT